jgi:hypothetical protein
MVTSLFCQMTRGLGAADQERRHRHAGAEPVDRGCGPAYEPRTVALAACRNVGAAAAPPSVTISARPSSSSSTGPGCGGRGRARAERQISASATRKRSGIGPALRPNTVRSASRCGTADELEARKRDDAKIRQAIAHDALAGLPHISHPNSYFTWLPLPEDARADRIAATLTRNHISVSTAEPFTTTTHTPQAIRLALGSADLATLPATLRTLARTIELDGFQ